MERGSDVHNPRIDDEMRRETDSLTHGEPVESRAEEFRLQEDAADGDPPVEPFVSRVAEEPLPGALSYGAVRERSELARHLRGSIFPADRTAIVQCAVEEHAPTALIEALEQLPAGRYLNVEGVWEALGGEREQRTRDEPHSEAPRAVQLETEPVGDTSDEIGRRDEEVEEFRFRFDLVHRLAGVPFLVSPSTTTVIVDRRRGVLVARFGPWRVETPLENVADTSPTGPYHPVKTIGPAHLSLADRGLTFATNDQKGLCIQFHSPVRGIDPLGLVHHPAITVTVDDVTGLRSALSN